MLRRPRVDGASPEIGRMIIVLLTLIAVGVVFIAVQARREGIKVIRPGFLLALAAVVIVIILRTFLPW